MRKIIFLSFALMLLLTFTACGQDTPVSPVLIEDGWIREAPPNATAMAGYMRITNTTDKHIILHSASSPDFNSIEFHRSVEKDGVYRMIPHLHLHIAANSTFVLEPGDYHLMLFRPQRQLTDGDQVTLTLTFSEQQQVEVVVPVRKMLQ